MQAELQEAVDALQRQYRRRPVKRLREAGALSLCGLPWTKVQSKVLDLSLCSLIELGSSGAQVSS